jgi:aminoglycoside phosphotransferase (APT) family kinase protein
MIMTASNRLPAKEEINSDLVRQLIANQFPQWASLPIRPVELDGWDNNTFRLGEEMSVRLPSAESYAAQVEKEHRWLPKLAPFLPLKIPMPLAMGAPSELYPWYWSIYRWIEGEPATIERITDLTDFALLLAQFLTALQQIDPTDGPSPGPQNFYRGGELKVYDLETRQAIQRLGDKIDCNAATAVWEAALKATWKGPPIWFHGDVAVGNLLVKNGQLSAVIDFGSSGVGDPACDLVIAWTLFSGKSRKAFISALAVDEAAWKRGRGWALWKALITLADTIDNNLQRAKEASHVIDEVIADHRHQEMEGS